MRFQTELGKDRKVFKLKYQILIDLGLIFQSLFLYSLTMKIYHQEWLGQIFQFMVGSSFIQHSTFTSSKPSFKSFC